MALVFVDVEARGASPVNGTMTEFGAVIYDPNGKHHKKTFHGRLYEGTPDTDNPAVPVVGKRINSDVSVVVEFMEWLYEVSPGQCTMVSDNPAYDFMWMAGLFDATHFVNPFGHSARRISDFWAGLNTKWGETQSWKEFRVTKHTHNPVDDAMGNVEAYEHIMTLAASKKAKEAGTPKW